MDFNLLKIIKICLIDYNFIVDYNASDLNKILRSNYAKNKTSF